MLRIYDMTLRDGLQSISKVFTCCQRFQMFQQIQKHLHYPNVYYEVGSTTSEKLLPQMKDSLTLYSQLSRSSNSTYGILSTQQKLLDKLIYQKIQGIGFVASLSNDFASKNLRCSSLSSFDTVFSHLQHAHILSKSYGYIPYFRIYISCTFGCRYESYTSEHKKTLREQVQRYYEWFQQNHYTSNHADIVLADTYGFCSPEQVKDVLMELKDNVSLTPYLALHLHTKSDEFKKPIDLGLQFGIHKFDTSIGGIGGCPYADKSIGNLSTGKLLTHVYGKRYNDIIEFEQEFKKEWLSFL